MGTEEDAGKILEYVYLQDEPVTEETLFEASELSDEEVRAALDELEERMLVEIGLSPDDAPYEDITLTAKGVDTIETSGLFHEEFDVSLDLNEIAQDWSDD